MAQVNAGSWKSHPEVLRRPETPGEQNAAPTLISPRNRCNGFFCRRMRILVNNGTRSEALWSAGCIASRHRAWRHSHSSHLERCEKDRDAGDPRGQPDHQRRVSPMSAANLSVFVTGPPEGARQRLQKVFQRSALADGQHRLDRKARPKLAVAEHRAHFIELFLRDDNLGAEKGVAALLVGEAVR